MSEPFLAQVMMAGFNFAPRGWAMCFGQLLPISQNTALYSLLGTTYGGDGKATFALPDLQGSAVVHAGTGQGLTPRELGETGGEDSISLISIETPAHTHLVQTFNNGGDMPTPQGNYLAAANDGSSIYSNTLAGQQQLMGMMTVGVTGGSQPHNNMQPYLAITFCIALEGIFPARN